MSILDKVIKKFKKKESNSSMGVFNCKITKADPVPQKEQEKIYKRYFEIIDKRVQLMEVQSYYNFNNVKNYHLFFKLKDTVDFGDTVLNSMINTFELYYDDTHSSETIRFYITPTAPLNFNDMESFLNFLDSDKLKEYYDECVDYFCKYKLQYDNFQNKLSLLQL